MKINIQTNNTSNFQGKFKKTPKLIKEISTYNTVQKYETLNLLKKISEVNDGKVYEYTGMSIIDIAKPETFETAYAVETSFLHRLKRFVSYKYEKCFENNDLEKSIEKFLK